MKSWNAWEYVFLIVLTKQTSGPDNFQTDGVDRCRIYYLSMKDITKSKGDVLTVNDGLNPFLPAITENLIFQMYSLEWYSWSDCFKGMLIWAPNL